MSFQVGDKVSFLNEKLEGVVGKVLNENSVEVITSDGFGIPALNAELVLVERNESARDKSKAITSSSNGGVSFSKRIDLARKMYLCFSKKTTETLELFVLNNESSRQFLTIRIKRQGKWTAIFASEISKSSYKFVDSYSTTELDSFSEIMISSINTEFSLTEIENPKTAKIKIKPMKFHKDSSFVDVPILEKNALLVPVESTPIEEEIIKEEIIKHVESPKGQEIVVKKLQGLKVLGKIDLSKTAKKVKLQNENEIDLHVEHDAKKNKGKSNGEIVQIQLNTAKDFLDKSMLSGKKEIVIIHGKGNGTLKSEISKLLKGYYGIKFEDGDFRKYGEGATLVYLKK
jgi:hypothetical protein